MEDMQTWEGCTNERSGVTGSTRTTYVLVELEGLVHLAGEAVDEEAALAVLPAVAVAFLCESCAHGVLEELDGDLHGHDLALADVLANHLAILGAFAVLLRTEKVAGCGQGG